MIDPNDYWVNNPLITPVNKALLYDNAIWNAKVDVEESIINWIKEHRSVVEVEAGINIVRDHFDSDDLISVINSGKYND